MKMLFGNMNVGSVDTTFKVFPEIFQIVDVRIAIRVFASAVIHRLMIESFFIQSFVRAQLVRVNRCAVQNIFFNDRLQGSL